MIFYFVFLVGVVELRTRRQSEELSDSSEDAFDSIVMPTMYEAPDSTLIPIPENRSAFTSDGDSSRIAKLVPNWSHDDSSSDSDKGMLDSDSFFAPVNQFDNFKGLLDGLDFTRLDGVMDTLTNIFEDNKNDLEPIKDNVKAMESDMEAAMAAIKAMEDRGYGGYPSTINGAPLYTNEDYNQLLTVQESEGSIMNRVQETLSNIGQQIVDIGASFIHSVDNTMNYHIAKLYN